MNSNYFEKCKSIFCCGRKANNNRGEQFGSEEFSVDSEFKETQDNVTDNSTESSTSFETSKTEGSNAAPKKKQTNESIKKVNKKDEKSKTSKDDIKRHVLKKLNMTESEINMVKNKKREESSNKASSVNEMTIEELDDILSSCSKDAINENKNDDKIAKYNNILKHLDEKRESNQDELTELKKDEVEIVELKKEIKKDLDEQNEVIEQEVTESTNESISVEALSSAEGNDASTSDSEELKKAPEVKSLRETNAVVQENESSGSSLSLNNFKRSVPNSASSTSESETTCYIKYQNKDHYSECLADKMKKHLKKD